MKRRIVMVVAAASVLAISMAGAEDIAGLPLHVEKIGDGAVRVWLGDHASTTTVVAFATEKGIVVVDTFGVPKVDAELRDVIARELGRSDFAFLINTHEHRDHTGGNSVYDDCTVVGHELVAEGLAKTARLRDFQLQWYPGHIAELEEELQDLDAGDPKIAALEENLTCNRLFFEAVEANQELAPPTLIFSDRMTLDLGDTTFELSYIGGMHTASDAAIFVPKYGLLLTGDLMADVWLTDAPGCLGNFLVRDGMPHDFPRFLANWDRLLAERERITTLMPAHWNGELSIEGAEARVEYVRTLWEGIHQASENKIGVVDVLTEYALATRFPELADSPGFSPQQNFASIAELWREVTGQASAARTLYRLLDEGADEAVIGEVLAQRDGEDPGYFFLEAELNAYGYIFLQREMADEAVKMFEFNVELFPESWNVYDSLGEALLRAGSTNEAVEMYEKSLALNPENTSGREVLARIHGQEST